MKTFKIAIATQDLADETVPLKVRLQKASRAGAEGVQCETRHELSPQEFGETACKALRHYLGELRLSLASLLFPARRSFYNQEYLDDRIAAVKQSLELASRLRVPLLCLKIGSLPPAETPDYALLRDVLFDLAAFANRTGLTLAVTPTPNDQSAALREFVESIPTGFVEIDFDPTAFLAGPGPSAAFAELHERVVHLTAHDGAREEFSIWETPLGRGEVPWDELLALVQDARAVQWVTLVRRHSDDAEADLSRGVQFLQNVMR